MEESEIYKGTVVTGTIGYDIHVIGIRLIERALRSAGFRVVTLGVQVSPEEFVAAAVETKADAILVSSLDGHAKLWVYGLRDKCTEAGVKDVLLYLGGMLIIGESNWEDTEKMFREMGFDRVYPQSIRPPKVIADLEGDLLSKSLK
jgi:methylaspartate mutase sigma subunit